MEISASDLKKEKEYLSNCFTEIDSNLSELNQAMVESFERGQEMKKYIWESQHEMDRMELLQNIESSDLEADTFNRKMDYLRKLYRIKDNPYFGRITYQMEDEDEPNNIYIGITHLTKDNNNLIYDWRSPIASLFYEDKLGDISYEAPGGKINGVLSGKRQYKIENRKLKAVIDNTTNITDDFLQEVLANESSDKMKNIVNTIQKEQDQIIRNTEDKHLVVQGIAGSGKTSVALHRIAYLLYKIPKLTSNNVLIFSPNNVFSEYISNVLPELGEANAIETTFHDFAKDYIDEYESVESFTSFIERYYLNEIDNVELSRVKLSDDFIRVMNSFYKEISLHAHFFKDIDYKNKKAHVEITRHELEEEFHSRYNKLPMFERIDRMAEHYCDKFGLPQGSYFPTIRKKLLESFNLKKDFKYIYKHLFKSKVFKKKFGYNLSDKEINSFVNGNQIYYEDALPFIYIKGLLQGFPYSSTIKEIVIDEAQDYSLLQYIILRKIFPRAGFTILGDINQTVNPVYHYESLEKLCRVLVKDYQYLELNKTYRSSKEIIEYANKILGLDHAVSVRRDNNIPVTKKKITNVKDIIPYYEECVKDYNKVAIITKTNDEADEVYEVLKDKYEDLTRIEEGTVKFLGKHIIIPSYLAKGLEFDSVIVYSTELNKYTEDEKYLFYVSVTRAQHKLVVFNQGDEND